MQPRRAAAGRGQKKPYYVPDFRSLTTLREKLIKIGAKVVAHSRYVIFQMAEVAVPKKIFQAILERIRRLRLPQTVPR